MTIAVPSRIAGVATGARVGRREQHEPAREHDGPLSPRQPDGAVLDRLPERLEGITTELRKLVQEQHAVLGKASLARRGRRTAAEETGARDRVMRSAERPSRNQGLAPEEAGHAVDASHLHGFIEAQRWP